MAGKGLGKNIFVSLFLWMEPEAMREMRMRKRNFAVVIHFSALAAHRDSRRVTAAGAEVERPGTLHPKEQRQNIQLFQGCDSKRYPP